MLSCNLLVLFRTTYYSKHNLYMVSPQVVSTCPFHHAKLQILLHGVTTNSLYLSFSPCKATNLTTLPQTVFTYPFHCAKLQILLHSVTANSLYLSFSPCKATNLTTWCHRKQSYPFHRAKLQIFMPNLPGSFMVRLFTEKPALSKPLGSFIKTS